MCRFIVSYLALKLMDLSLESEDVLLHIRNLIIEGILFAGISVFKFFEFLPIDLSQTVDFFKKMGDLSILESELCI